jgi:hypothetical protein
MRDAVAAFELAGDRKRAMKVLIDFGLDVADEELLEKA